MQPDTEQTDVIFRKFKDRGDIIALFPGHAGSVANVSTCMSYAHVGQHGAAMLGIVRHGTVAAKPEEYASLQRELVRIGYNLHIVNRATAKHRAQRREQIERSRW